MGPSITIEQNSGGASHRPVMRDLLEHPDFLELALPRRERMQVDLMHAPAAIDEVTYLDTAELDAECALVADAPFAETFMTAPSPGIVVAAMEDRHYGDRAAYVQAVADALRTEYRGIADRGLLLQIDAPDLAMERHTLFAERSLDEFVEWVALVVGAINGALDGIDPQRVRLHVCWGNYEGPHTHDIPLQTILPLVLKAKPSMLLIEGANPRHEHEWEVWASQKLPEDKVLVPGVIDTSTNYVEHPELVAQRITRFANLVGPERVIASTDCGMGTFAGFGPVHPDIAWEKLRVLTRGAAMASIRLAKPAAIVV